MRIGVDIMGGDYAPEEAVKGVILASRDLPASVQLVLLGDKQRIIDLLQKEDAGADQSFEIIDAPEVIGMGEHPTKAISQKQNSSIVVGFKLLKDNQIDAFAGAGNTGAMLVGAMYTVKTIPGVIRPTISTIVPKESGKIGIMLDVGANADCKPDTLSQFATLGSLYAKHVYKIDSPKVGLLNIGEEEGKGNLLTQATYTLMKDCDKYNFIGNIEGNDLFNDKADVMVCDGFTGNIALKLSESLYTLLRKRNIKDEYFDTWNYELYGGTPILGVNAPVVIGHGISNAKAFKSMINLTKDLVDSKLTHIFKETFN